MVVGGSSGSERRLREELGKFFDDAEIIEASDGREGLELLESRVDCIVSRYELDEIDGLEFLRAVRERYSELPFVLITDEGSEAVASDSISAGVTDYLDEGRFSEPYAELATRIETHVSEPPICSGGRTLADETDGKFDRLSLDVLTGLGRTAVYFRLRGDLGPVKSRTRRKPH